MLKNKRPSRKLGQPDPCGSPWSLLRAERGWTLARLSAETDLSIGYLCHIERARKAPGLKAMQALAAAYELTLDRAQHLTERTARWAQAA